jgi:hypothetical protein
MIASFCKEKLIEPDHGHTARKSEIRGMCLFELRRHGRGMACDLWPLRIGYRVAGVSLRRKSLRSHAGMGGTDIRPGVMTDL